jgi:adenylate cyclase
LPTLEKGFRLGELEVRPLEGAIAGSEGVERVQPKVMQVLVHLALNAGQVVTRDQLLEAVWRGAPMTDEVLNRCISELRRHLKDKPRSPRFLETIPKVGYRLIAPVGPPRESQAANVAPTAADTDREAVATRSPRVAGASREPDTVASQRWAATLPAFAIGILSAGLPLILFPEALMPLILALAGGGLLVWVALGRMPERGNAPPGATPDGGGDEAAGTGSAAEPAASTSAPPDGDEASVAVLPFQSLSPQAERRFLADGIATEMHSTLSKLHRLRVASRTSSFAIDGASTDIRDIGRRLNVRYVLSGSLYSEGDRMRVIAELDHAQKGIQIWSETYDRDVGDVFTVQHEIARAIVSAFGGERLREEIASASVQPAADLDAWSLVQKARSYILRYSLRALTEAVALLRQAVELDPAYGAAHAALASVLAERVLNGYSDDPAAEEAEARDAATRAMDLAPTHPFVLKMCGVVHAYFGEVGASVAALRRAVEIAPFDYGARGYLGWPLVQTGEQADLDELHEILDENLRLAPNHPGAPYWLYHRSVAYSCADKNDRAVEFAEKSIGGNPTFAWSWLQYGNTLGSQGEIDKARQAAAHAAEVNPSLTPALFRSRVERMSRSAAFTARRIRGLQAVGVLPG